MVSRIWFVNVILAVLVVFLGLKAYGVWSRENCEIPEMVERPVARVVKPLRTLDERKVPPESEYDALMTLNLFSPERTEVLPDETAPDEKSKTLSSVDQKNIEQNFSKFTLYGMVITDNSAEALVSCPTTPPVFKRGTRRKRAPVVKQTKWVKAGDALDNFKVVAIKPDRVLLEAGGQSYDLLLYGNEQVKNRGSAKPKPGPTVVGAAVNAPVPNVSVKKIAKPPTASQATEAPEATVPSRGGRPPAIQENIKRDLKKRQTGGFGIPQPQ